MKKVVNLFKGKECKHSFRFEQTEDPIEKGLSISVYVQKDTFKEMGSPAFLRVSVETVSLGKQKDV
jgi:hypothetical protein